MEKRAVEHTVNILPVRMGGEGRGGVHGRGSHGPATPSADTHSAGSKLERREKLRAKSVHCSVISTTERGVA